jgi:hypothetical protein
MAITAPTPRKGWQTAEEHIEPERIRRRAYELYEQRGGRDGADLDDWLRAESELTQKESKPMAA